MSAFAAPLGLLAIAGAISLALGEGRARRGVMLTAAIIASGWALSRLSPGADAIAALGSEGEAGEYVSAIVKGVGISWATAITALFLGELGEAGGARAAQLVGAAELCALAIPLAMKLISSALSLV